MNILERISNEYVFFDGAMGTQLQKYGILPGENPEHWNISRPDIITKILKDSDMISYLPDFVTKDFIKSGELCYLDVSDIKIDIWKQLIYHKNKWMSKALKTVIDYIKTHEFEN